MIDPGTHLTLEDVGIRRRDRWLVRGLSWQVPRGRFIAVLGPSGVGKTSLFDCLSGMLPPKEGRLTWCCRKGCSHRPDEFQHELGIVFQHLHLIPNATVLHNVLCGRLGRHPSWRTLFGFPRKDVEMAARILDDLGILHLAHRWVSEISGGERQRTDLARALLQAPEEILADEPVSSLDSYLAGRVLGILRQQAHEQGRTVLCVLHQPDLVERFADEALSLDPIRRKGWQVRKIRTP